MSAHIAWTSLIILVGFLRPSMFDKSGHAFSFIEISTFCPQDLWTNNICKALSILLNL